MFGVGQNPGALVEIGSNGGIAPAMAIHADLAIAVEIIQQDIFTGQLMMIGGDPFAIEAKSRVAIANGLTPSVFQVAQDLVVGSVLLDDIQHVLDWARLAHLIGNDRFAAKW